MNRKTVIYAIIDQMWTSLLCKDESWIRCPPGVPNTLTSRSEGGIVKPEELELLKIFKTWKKADKFCLRKEKKYVCRPYQLSNTRKEKA